MTKTCSTCEYFDMHFEDCLNGASDRFQTQAGRPACPAYFAADPNESDEGDEVTT